MTSQTHEQQIDQEQGADLLEGPPEGLRTLGAGDLLPPDIVFYNGYYPSNSKVSYATFGALNRALGGANAFSYSMRLRFRGYSGVTTGWTYGQDILSFRDAAGRGGSVSISYGDMGMNLLISYVNGTFQTVNVELNRWYHLGFTWDGTTATIYIDGAPRGSMELSKDVIDRPVFRLGRDATNPPQKPSMGVTSGPFSGDIINLFVWGKALSASEMTQQVWVLPSEPIARDALLLGYDFTANPPRKVGSGPDLKSVNPTFQSESPSLFSWGSDVVKAGPGTTANPGGAQPFSALAWVFLGNPAWAAPKTDGYIVSNGDVADGSHFGLRLEGGKLVAELGDQTVKGATQLQGYTWYYVAVTYDGSSAKLYVNNTLDGSGPITGGRSPTASAIRLMGAEKNRKPYNCMQGYLQFLSIWNRALTEQEIVAQATEDPTLNPSCAANFMCSSEPCLDSTAVKGYGLWRNDQLLYGSGVSMGTQRAWYTQASVAPGQARRPERKLRDLSGLDIRLAGNPGAIGPATAPLLSDAHKQRMIDELKHALTSIPSAPLRERLLKDYEAELNEVCDAYAQGTYRPRHTRVTYALEGGQYALFYQGDDGARIDLGVRVDISQKCAIWWTSFTLNLVLGLLEIFGIPTPIDDLTNLASRIVRDPVVISTLTSVTGATLTAGATLSLLKVLYDFGYLSQAIWLAFEKLSWYAATKFILYVIGIFAPAATPAQALFIAQSIKLVVELGIQLTHYNEACGSGVCEVPETVQARPLERV